jgi:hypothetical protein
MRRGDQYWEVATGQHRTNHDVLEGSRYGRASQCLSVAFQKVLVDLLSEVQASLSNLLSSIGSLCTYKFITSVNACSLRIVDRFLKSLEQRLEEHAFIRPVLIVSRAS